MNAYAGAKTEVIESILAAEQAVTAPEPLEMDKLFTFVGSKKS